MRPPYSYRDDRAVPCFPDEKPIIIFDGLCALCSGSAAFVLRHDHAGTFRLLAAQSELGQALYEHYGLDPLDYESMILIADGIAWFKLALVARTSAELCHASCRSSALRRFNCATRIIPQTSLISRKGSASALLASTGVTAGITSGFTTACICKRSGVAPIGPLRGTVAPRRACSAQGCHARS